MVSRAEDFDDSSSWMDVSMNGSDSEMSTAGGIDARSGSAGASTMNNSKTEQEVVCGYQLLMSVVAALGGVATTILPSVAYVLQVDMMLTLNQVVALIALQRLVLSFSTLVWGVLVEQGIVKCKTMVVIGCTGVGIVFGLSAMVSSGYPLIALFALSGIFLGCCQSSSNCLATRSVAGCDSDKKLGLFQVGVDVGVMTVALVATPLSLQNALGLQGWRLCFLAILLMFWSLAAYIAVTLSEPMREGAERSIWGHSEAAQSMLKQELCQGWKTIMTPELVFIMTPGALDCIPWAAMADCMTLYFQTAGFGGLKAGTLVFASRAAQSLGRFAGRAIGDLSVSKCPHHGRAIVAQLSTIMAVPLLYLIFLGIPPDSGDFGWCLVTLVGLGLMATWPFAATHRPMLAEIVPAESRRLVLAGDSALTGTSGAIFGGPLVALLAQSCFGYNQDIGDHAPTPFHKARALGTALACVSIASLLLSFTFYSAMHWRLLDNLKRTAREQRELENKHGTLEVGKMPGPSELQA